jgi:hypothetical protein
MLSLLKNHPANCAPSKILLVKHILHAARQHVRHKQYYYMQRTAFWLMAALWLLLVSTPVSAGGYRQGITLKKTNASLEQVFRDIEKQSGYQFFYKVSFVPKFKKVDVHVTNVSIEQALEMVLKNQPFTYQIISKTIVIKEKMVIVETAAPVPAGVSGRVVNESHVALAGVSIVVKGSSRGTTTNENGLFELPDVNTTDAVLVITYIGYEEQEIKLNGRTSLTVTLKLNAQRMEDVTVSVSTGYQTLLKGRVTGSFEVLKGDEMNKVAATDYRSRLEGLVPGISVGRNNNLTIRGQGTFSANRSPLVVVDGVPVQIIK